MRRERRLRPARTISASRPDKQYEVAAPLRLENVPKSRRLGDGTNALEIYNVPSEHTDEYFVFWFPGP